MNGDVERDGAAAPGARLRGPRELIIWRHAHAGESVPDPRADFERPLSARGRRQAGRAAAWLAARLGEESYDLVSSPAPRARQTAAALGIMRIDPRLAPDAGLDEALEAVSRVRAPTAVLVGHQPLLGELIAQLVLEPDRASQGLALRKGAAWWLRARDGGYDVVAVHGARHRHGAAI